MFFLKELPDERILKKYATRFAEMDIDKTRRALGMMRQASLLIRALDAYFRPHGLSLTRFLVLIVLDREDNSNGTLCMTDLGKRLDVSKPVMTKTLRAMEKSGFIAIQGCEKDNRSKRIILTGMGRDILAQTLPGYYRTINMFMDDMDGRER